MSKPTDVDAGQKIDCYEVELRASIERGLADSDAGRVIAVEDLMRDSVNFV